MRRPGLIYEDDSERWFRDVLENHEEEARERALSLLDQGIRRETGCIESGTVVPRKVRFHGKQLTAYRFVYCVLHREIASRDHVVRHRCHNRLCLNPRHLELGSPADNKRDDWENWAGGVDYDWL